MLIREYKEEWQQQFQNIQTVLQTALDGLNINIEHIGSTSVPGLAAKPIIDIDIVFQEDVDFEDVKSGLLKIGYFHNGNQGIPSREAFKRKDTLTQHPSLDNISHHLYVCRFDSEELQRHLLFRNYLRKNDWAKKEYEAIKYDIANQAGQDRKQYALIKEKEARKFVLSILGKAKGK
jgi:GrpB-like predicted nucleotidyltransferase (UPF0157 family)